MVQLNVQQHSDGDESQGGCGTSCGAGMEKIYPTLAVRYGAMNWVGEFAYKRGMAFSCGGKVVIQTSRGIEIGEQISLSCSGCTNSVSREQIKRYIQNSGPEFFRLRSGRVMRQATPDDLRENARLCARIPEDIDRCALLAAQLGLNLKIVSAERLFGDERLVFYFYSQERVDFRELVRSLAQYYRTRIEMRQVGARDEARLVADYEICGRECCCKNFLKKLRPVTMKMAKLQKSTLDPSKVSGRCGRLRCCLRYEHEGYESLLRKLPRIGSWVQCDFGAAQVIDRQILTQLVLVRAADGKELTIPIEEITAMNVPAPAGFRSGGPDAPLQRRSDRDADVSTGVEPGPPGSDFVEDVAAMDEGELSRADDADSDLEDAPPRGSSPGDDAPRDVRPPLRGEVRPEFEARARGRRPRRRRRRGPGPRGPEGAGPQRSGDGGP